jgi:hypothetical protein
MDGKMAGEDLMHADVSLIQYVGYHGPVHSDLSLLKFAKTMVLTRCERYTAL